MLPPSAPPGSFWRARARRTPFFRGGKLVPLSGPGPGPGPSAPAAAALASLPRLGLVRLSLEGAGQGLGGVEEGADVVAFAGGGGHDVVAAVDVKGLIRVFKVGEDGGLVLVKRFASQHTLPVSDVDVDPTGAHVATGGVDMSVRVFSVQGGFPTHNFAKGHRGAISLVRFHPSRSRLLLCSADVAGAACLWDLHSKESLWLRSHMSTVTSVCFLGKRFLATGGRDRVVCVWTHTPENREEPLVKTIPVLEAVEAVVTLPQTTSPEVSLFAVAGVNGVVRVYSFHHKTFETAVMMTSENFGVPFSGLFISVDKTTLLATSDLESQVVFLSCADLKETRPALLGFDDEVTDVDFIRGGGGGGGGGGSGGGAGPETETLVLGTNSDTVRVMTLVNASWGGQSQVRLLKGHTGPVLSVAASTPGGGGEQGSAAFFVTGSKDQTARVWNVHSLECIGVCTGHTDSVTSVAAGTTASRLCFTCGGDDGSVRAWYVSATAATGVNNVVSCGQRVAHQAGATVMDVSVSHDDAHLGTCSMDKTAKIWALRRVDGKKKQVKAVHMDLVCELKGHRRAVHSIRFSTVDRVACTSSSDATVKVWSFKGECVRTLEGHGAPVTTAMFLASTTMPPLPAAGGGSGQVLMSASADGVIKTWDLKTSLCLQTNEHSPTDKVWALALSPYTHNVCSVGTDGTTVVWEDCTESERETAFLKSKQELMERQELDKAVREGRLHQAAMLALKMGHVHQLRLVLERVDAPNVPAFVRDLVGGTEDRAKVGVLLKSVSSWNTSVRTCAVAQRVVGALLPLAGEVTSKVGPSAWAEFCAGVEPYTERHAKRIHVLEKDSYLLDHVLFVASGDESGMLV